MGPGQLLTPVLSSFCSLSERRPGQWLQNLRFHSLQDCGTEYFRISASSESQWDGQLGLNSLTSPLRVSRIGERMGLLLRMAMRTQKGVNDTRIYGLQYIILYD